MCQTLLDIIRRYYLLLRGLGGSGGSDVSLSEPENFSTAVVPKPPKTIQAIVSYIKESIDLSKNKLAKNAIVQNVKARRVTILFDDNALSSWLSHIKLFNLDIL
jgi:hypothetical protein